MSSTLFFLVPIGILAVVWSLCFVGACFPTSGLPGTPYSNTILMESGLVAYWPLSDLKGSPTAADLSGQGHTGTYTFPPAYPTGQGAAPFVPNPPTLDLQQGSLVPGDGFTTGSKNLPFSVDFEGGYVSIPWSTQNPSKLGDFTLEAWVQPHWTQSQSGFLSVVFGAVTATTGFALFINQQNQWQITIGNGTTTYDQVNTMVTADLGSTAQSRPTTYVAVTFDSTSGTLSLWINPDSDTSAPPTPAFSMTTTYVAVDPTQTVTFFIGTGDNEDAQTLRTQPMGAGAPRFPFLGQIQSVALYNVALGASTLQTHFSDGASSDT